MIVLRSELGGEVPADEPTTALTRICLIATPRYSPLHTLKLSVESGEASIFSICLHSSRGKQQIALDRPYPTTERGVEVGMLMLICDAEPRVRRLRED